MTEALVVVDPAKRSVVTFTFEGDPWPTIARWAQQHRFLPRSSTKGIPSPYGDSRPCSAADENSITAAQSPQTGSTKLFQKGTGLWTAPMRAQFTRRGSEIELQAWVHLPLLARILALFLLPQEMNVKSGGFRAMVPRAIARKAVNELLVQVGAQPIP